MTERRAAAVFGPVVVGGVELLGLVLVPLVIRASGCIGLDCLLVAAEVLLVATLGCGAAAVAVLWVVARHPMDGSRSRAQAGLLAGIGTVCWILLAIVWLRPALAIGGMDSMAGIVVVDTVAASGTVGIGYLAVAAVRHGGRAFGWFVAAAVVAVLALCVEAFVAR